MDRQEEPYSREASASDALIIRETTEDENWVYIDKTVMDDGIQTHSPLLEKDATTSYSTNREKVIHKNAGTVEETHVLESSGKVTKDFSEEHWSSKIKSYKTPQPPKFIQVIKAFRVLPSDTLTLVVEVQSDPPAIFEWFCNDKPVQQDKRRFKARHGINITTLTVEGPEHGVYKCTARNPAGVSTTYGFVTVSTPPSYKAWLSQHEMTEETNAKVTETAELPDKKPKFINQIPNLTLRPGTEAVIDVEVEASPPARFAWYVNGIQYHDTHSQIQLYYPVDNRCVARFPIPESGEYKVIAENRVGKAQSIGYLDVKKEMHRQTQLPPLPCDQSYLRTEHITEKRELPLRSGTGRSSSVTRTVDVFEENSYYQRSTSLPRSAGKGAYEIKKTTEIIRKRKDDESKEQLSYSSLKEIVSDEKIELQKAIKRRRKSDTSRTLPHAPAFTSELPQEVRVSSKEDLVLSVGIDATPQADVKWNVNGFELKDSKQVTMVNEEDRSKLVVQSPVRYGRYGISAMNNYGMVSQTTYVRHEEEEEFQQIEDEMIIQQGMSMAPDFQDGAITVETHGDWDVVDKHHYSDRATESHKTVDSTEKTVHEEAVQSEPKYRAEPIHKPTCIRKIWEESSTKHDVIQTVPVPSTTQWIEESSELMKEQSKVHRAQPVVVSKIEKEFATDVSKTTSTEMASLTKETKVEEGQDMFKKDLTLEEATKKGAIIEQKLLTTTDAKSDVLHQEMQTKTVFKAKLPVSSSRTTEIEERGMIEVQDIVRVPQADKDQVGFSTEKKWEEVSTAKSEITYRRTKPLALRKTEEEELLVQEKELVQSTPKAAVHEEIKWMKTTYAETESTSKAPSPEVMAIDFAKEENGEITERELLTRTVTPPVEPAPGTTFTERKWVEVSSAKSVSRYEAPPPLPPKPVTPVIHESNRESALVMPTMHDTVMITSTVLTHPQKITRISVGRSEDETLVKGRDVYIQPPTVQTTKQDSEEIFVIKQESINALKPTFQLKPRTTTEPLPKRPFVLKQPESVINVKAGEKLVLESKVDSYPEAQCKWYQNNFEVKPSSQVTVEQPAMNESRVTFLRPISGIYKFVASNIHGSCSSTTRVIVEVTEDFEEENTITIVRVAEKQEPRYHLIKRPRVERANLPRKPQIVASFAPVLHVPEREPLILRAVAEAMPEAEFTWRLNNFEVRPSQTVAVEQLGPNTSQATFRVPVSGRYEVIARNKLGHDSRSCKVLITYKEEASITPPVRPIIKSTVPRIPVFIKPLPGEVQLMPGESEFHLSVGVHGEQPLTFRWFANGSLLSNSIIHQMINDLEASTLVVHEIIRCDVDYAVEVSNIHGAVWSETTVKPAPREASVASHPSTEAMHATVRQLGPPRFITALTSLELQEDDQFTARVAVSHDTAPCEFSWALNGRDARMLPGIRTESELYQSTLYVQSVKPKHAGEMMVFARNKYGSAKSSAIIIVAPLREETYVFVPDATTVPEERAPRVITSLESTVFTSGETLKLHCRFDALPPPEIIWIKDEIRIDEWVTEKEVISRLFPDGTCELIKPECGPEDTGRYQCIARNIHGTAETSSFVTVETVETITAIEEKHGFIHDDRRSVALMRPQITELTSRQYENTVVITCQVISDTMTEVKWYHKKEQLFSSEKHRMETLSDNLHVLTITDTKEEDEGLYKCIIENEYGRSESSIFIRPTLKTHSVTEELLAEENIDEVIGVLKPQEYVKKKYTDVTMKVSSLPEISGSQEMYSHTAELRKSEEEYKLLVKVAETVASRLVANIVIDEAIYLALRHIRAEVHSSEEEETEIKTVEQQPSAPRFETSIECYTVEVGDTVVLKTDVSGYPTPHVEWYFFDQKLEQFREVEIKYTRGQATLTIEKIAKQHEGIYYCHAENIYGKAVLSCNLRVVDTKYEHGESIHRLYSVPLTYTPSGTAAEVSSNIHVNRVEEFCEHHFSMLQPELITFGYSCIASTSKRYDDSLIITRESVQRELDERRRKEVRVLMPSEETTTLNVNAERTEAQAFHDATILYTPEEPATLLSPDLRVSHTREVNQAKDVQLIEEKQVTTYRASTENTTVTVILERPSQAAIHEVTCICDEKEFIRKDRMQAVTSVDLRNVEAFNDVISSVLATKEANEAHAVANVDVHRPAAQFDNLITVIEPEAYRAEVKLVAPKLMQRLARVDVEMQCQGELLGAEVTVVQHPRRHARAEQRIVILQGLTQKFTEAVTWSLKKIQNETDIPVANANVEIRKPEEIGEHTTTIIDTVKMVSELLAIAATASKLKIASVFIKFTKKSDVAHQALMIEYESIVEDEASLNVALLTAPGFYHKKEEIWSRERKYIEERCTEKKQNVVAVFVEVDATCPDQKIELVASVSIPSTVSHLLGTRESAFEQSSISRSESSSAGGLQAPKFVKNLESAMSNIGSSYQFKCIVTGVPIPYIRWYVDGDEIHDSDLYQTVYEDGVCILKIKELAVEDEGEYTCIAQNDVGRAITKCFLHVLTSYMEISPGHYITSSTNEKSIGWEESYGLENISIAGINSIENISGQYTAVDIHLIREKPVVAQTTGIVTRYTKPQAALRHDFTNEERSFLVSVTLPGVHGECEETFIVREYIRNVPTLFTKRIETVEAILHLIRTADVGEACYLIFDLSFASESCNLVVFQLWEELLLRKKPQNALVSLLLREQSTKSTACHNVNLNPNNDSCFFEKNMSTRSFYSFIDVIIEKECATMEAFSETIQETVLTVKLQKYFQVNEEYKQPCDTASIEPRTPSLPRKITYDGKEMDISVHSDDSTSLKERSAKVVKSFAVSDAVLLSKHDVDIIRKYVDDLLDSNFPFAIISATRLELQCDNFNTKNPGHEQTKTTVGIQCPVNDRDKSVISCHEKIPINILANPNSTAKIYENRSVEPILLQFSEEQGLQNSQNANQNSGISGDESKESIAITTSTLFVKEDGSSSSEITRYTDKDEGNPLPQTGITDGIKVRIAENDTRSNPGSFKSKARPIPGSDYDNLTASSSSSGNNHVFEQTNSIKEFIHMSKVIRREQSGSSTKDRELNQTTQSQPDDETVEDVLDVIRFKERSSPEDASEIERAIFHVSEEIGRQQPVSDAQAEAREELLKATLEDIILSSGSKTIREAVATYRKPIALLKQKLDEVEKFLLYEGITAKSMVKPNEKTESYAMVKEKPCLLPSECIRDQFLSDTSSTSGIRAHPGTFHVSHTTVLKHRNEEHARLIPLTRMIQNEMRSLERVLDTVEEEAELEEATTESCTSTNSMCIEAKRQEVHKVLVQINNEIGSIKHYCRHEVPKKSAELVSSILNKIRIHISTAADLISTSKGRIFRQLKFSEKHPKKETKQTRINSPKPTARLTPLTKTGFFFGNDASINILFVKPEQVEVINAIVMLQSSSEQSGGHSTQRSLLTDSSAYGETVAMTLSDDLQPHFSEMEALPTSDSSTYQANDNHSTNLNENTERPPVAPPRRRRKNILQDGKVPVAPLRLKKRLSPCDGSGKINSNSSTSAKFKSVFGSSALRNTSRIVASKLPASKPVLKRSKSLSPEQSNSATTLFHSLNEMTVPGYPSFPFSVQESIIEGQVHQECTGTLKSAMEVVEHSLIESLITTDIAFTKSHGIIHSTTVLPLYMKHETIIDLFDETASVQLICEESDYAPEVDTVSSILFIEGQQDNEDDEEALLQRLAMISNISTTDARRNQCTQIYEYTDSFVRLIPVTKREYELHESDSHDVEMLEDRATPLAVRYDSPVSECSDLEEDNIDVSTLEGPNHLLSDTKQLRMNSSYAEETGCLQEVESVRESDEIPSEFDDFYVICNPHAGFIDTVDVLPTIMEISCSSKNANSFMSLSSNTVVAASQASCNEASTASYMHIPPVSAVDMDDENNINYRAEYEKRILLVRESVEEKKPEEVTINLVYKRCSSKLKVIAVLFPEIRTKVEVPLVREDLDVLVEQPNEEQNFTLQFLEQMSDTVSLSLSPTFCSATIDVDLSLAQDEQCAAILSYQLGNIKHLPENNADNIQQEEGDISSEIFEKCAGVTVNIVARSMHDMAHASLEEIPWGEVSMHIPSTEISQSFSDSETKTSLIQNVTVSESNETERRSVISRESFRSSSHRSFDLAEFPECYDSWHNLNIPSYLIKEGSTATITCEFNNFLAPGSVIVWYKGKTVMQIVPGKTDRISHDLLEVLVIQCFDHSDSDVYCIKVNENIYPVACVLVDDELEIFRDEVRFLSPPQTLFVMEGQPSIISCQVSNVDAKVEWCKDNKWWVTENERLKLESDQYGFHRIIINQSELEDQGTYYSFLGDHFTTVTLVVEERIDEREVTISASSPESEEDEFHEYLVPRGSTATIACEMEDGDEIREFIWRRDGIPMRFEDDTKAEHVINGLKHYLVIHNTQPEDSACYSVSINNIEFKIAHMIVSEYATSIVGKRTKRISSSSLHA